MIAPYVAAAARAPLRTRPNHLEAEGRHVAERDRASLFGAALEQFARDRRVAEPELAL